MSTITRIYLLLRWHLYIETAPVYLSLLHWEWEQKSSCERINYYMINTIWITGKSSEHVHQWRSHYVGYINGNPKQKLVRESNRPGMEKYISTLSGKTLAAYLGNTELMKYLVDPAGLGALCPSWFDFKEIEWQIRSEPDRQEGSYLYSHLIEPPFKCTNNNPIIPW